MPESTLSLRKLKDTEKNANMNDSMIPKARPPSDCECQLHYYDGLRIEDKVTISVPHQAHIVHVHCQSGKGDNLYV